MAELMAYDDYLVDRVREILAGRPDYSEKRMFGGLAFLLGGRMALAASSKGGLMVRIDPAECETLVRENGVEHMVMSGREMDGWSRVAADNVRTDKALRQWVTRGVDVVQTLPAK